MSISRLHSTTWTLLFCALVFSTMSCRQKGCTDPNSETYDQDAEKDDGSCQYRYLVQVDLTQYPHLDANGDDWDIGSGPDLLLKLAPASDTVWTYVSNEYENVLCPATILIFSDIQFTNESWQFELWDADWTSADDFMATGQFNPLSSGSNGVISVINTTVDFDFHYEVRD